jgi:hypothetical protein
MLSLVILNFVMVSVVMLSAIMLSVIMLSVVRLSVAAPANSIGPEGTKMFNKLNLDQLVSKSRGGGGKAKSPKLGTTKQNYENIC